MRYVASTLNKYGWLSDELRNRMKLCTTIEEIEYLVGLNKCFIKGIQQYFFFNLHFSLLLLNLEVKDRKPKKPGI